MTNHVELTYGVGDTTPRFTINNGLQLKIVQRFTIGVNRIT